MEKYYQKDIECASPETIRGWQNEKIVSQVRNVWDNVPYYRALMEEKGVCPDDIKSIDDISKLPFISKADLREAYPFGLLARPLSECVRIHSTSGTTGKRVIAFYTQHDIDLWDDCCCRALAAAGAESRTVTVGVRPVHVTVGDEGIDAQIDVSELMGSELHLHMTAGGKDVVAVVQTANLDPNAYARHTAVRFSFEPRLIHLFDPETEKNLI